VILMSRIDDAMRRAGTPGEQTPGGRPSTEEPSAQADAPWTIDAPTAPQHPTEDATPERSRTSDRGSFAKPQSRRQQPQEMPATSFQGFSTRVVEKLVTAEHPVSASVEQFRRVAAGLHHLQVDRGINIVMVASALASEGKTLTSTNLALTLSESYQRKVLLVDADLRRPALHDVFQVPNLMGLGDGLRSKQEQKLPLIQVSPTLTLLPAGKPDPDPMSGLTSERMKRVVAEASEQFDWVILDTPPVAILPDANLVAAMVDVIVLVVDAGRTSYTAVQKAVESVGRDRIMGVVLNRVKDRDLAAHYGYSSYSYRYGGRYGRSY